LIQHIQSKAVDLLVLAGGFDKDYPSELESVYKDITPFEFGVIYLKGKNDDLKNIAKLDALDKSSCQYHPEYFLRVCTLENVKIILLDYQALWNMNYTKQFVQQEFQGSADMYRVLSWNGVPQNL